MKRKGSAVWKGEIKSGEGVVSTESGVLDAAPYSFAKRFGDEPGTNPEELIGAAHAACYSMALSGALGKAGIPPEEISTSAEVSIDKDGEGFKISTVRLTVTARIPGASEEDFLAAAQGAKENCPVSKLLNAEITLDATLES